MAETDYSCVQPSKGPIDPAADNATSDNEVIAKEVRKVIAQVGKPAPDFEATAYYEGGFKNIKLSDYKGQWVTLCFYPGDFTFV